jgi:hypothetical protein
MNTVIFETGKAVFHFDLQDVFASLQDHSSCDRDAADLVNILEPSSSETRRIPSEKGFFGYIVVDLFSRDKGFVFCKDCQKTHLAEELQFIPIGFGESPLTVKVSRKGGILKKIFGRKIKGVGMMGAKRFDCPKGHELISMITWIS